MSRVLWTMENVALLRKLHADGLSTAQISQRFGCTRSAIHGKLDRLGLIEKKDKPAKKERAAPRKPPASNFNPFKSLGRKKAEASPPLSPDQREYILGQGISLFDLGPESCRWPLNEPARTETYLFCGAKIESDQCPYCGYHARMAYEPRRRAA